MAIQWNRNCRSFPGVYACEVMTTEGYESCNGCKFYEPVKQKILIIGGGGREHAIGWKIAQSGKVGQIFFAPGNGGTTTIGTNVDIKATDLSQLVNFAKKEKIDLTLALPDDPLALGVVDVFQVEGLRIWGPTKAASEL